MSSSICRVVRDPTTKEAVSYSFDAAKLTVTEPKALKKGKFSNVRYNGGALYMESPLLHLPMGISSFEDDDKKSIFVSCRGHDEQEDVRLFVAALEAAQDKIIDQVSSMKVLGDKATRDMVSGFMTPLLKPSDRYPPGFRVALPFREGKASFDTFKKENGSVVKCNLEDVDIRGAKVKVIFNASSVWVVNNKNWGVSLKASQLLIKPSFDIPATGVSCFSDENLEESDEEGGAAKFDQAASDNED